MSQLYYKNAFSLFTLKLILILWIIININIVQSQFTLKRRFTHNAHLIDDKLWFFGGGTMINGILSPTGDVFYIDLTKPFDYANVQYVAKAASPFSCAWCQSAIGNNQSKILFFAGVMIIPDSSTLTDSIVYSFDIKTQTWSTPSMTGMIPSRRRELQPVSDQNGKIYMFGGGSDMTQTIQIFATMNILDSVSYIWTTGSQLNSPLPRIDYTATLLPNGNIIYIGGSQSNLNVIHFDNVNMNEIDMYNTITGTWTSTMATGATITSRTGHTAVLNKKGEIIIYGGVYSTSLVSSDPSIAVLNTTTNPYQWSIPSVNTSEVNPPNLIFHTANLVENYMIVAFGNITKTAINEELPGQSDQLYILDINTFTWVKTFNPPDNNPEPASANESESNNSINTIMIILIVVAVVLIIIGSTIGIIIYRRKRRSSDDLQINYPPHVVSQQVTASQIDADSIFTSKSNVGAPRDMHQFNGDIKQHQYIASNLLPSEISSDTNHYARDSKDGDINDTNHYTINNNTTPQYGGSNRAYNYGGNSNAAHHYGGNNNTTHHYGGDNNTAHQYRSNNNITHHYGDNSQYATDTNIAPAHETFSVSPDQPFGVVMLNTQSGEMIVPPNVQTTSNYNNYNNYNYRFS